MKRMSKSNIALDVDKWDIYKIADFTVAFILVVISMVSADIPRHRIEIVKKPAPYVASGWSPMGQQLNLPLRAAHLPTPAASYGPPPPPTDEPAYTTTEEPVTTTEPAAENLTAQKSENLEAAPEKDKETEPLDEPSQGGQYYIVLPQQQNLIFSVPKTATLLAVPKGDLVAATTARLQAVPFTSVAASAIYTPFSGSYIQIYQ